MVGKSLIFVCSGVDYHAIDWYRRVKNLKIFDEVKIATDIKSGESYDVLLDESDDILDLVSLGPLLFDTQSRAGNLWRNILKFLSLPFSALKLWWHVRREYKKGKETTCHAHSIFYGVVCRLAGVPYVLTPMGSDVLVRPEYSQLYTKLAVYSLKKAQRISVDSEHLADAVFRLSGKTSVLIQNGINTAAALEAQNTYRFVQQEWTQNMSILSPRALDENYRVDKILASYQSITEGTVEMLVAYPFVEEGYKSRLNSLLSLPGVHDLGRLSRDQLYRYMASASLVVSIPYSDSSPRSVYEAIFCGAAVATVNNSWIKMLPRSMRERVIQVNIDEGDWLNKSLLIAKNMDPLFSPCEQALAIFDEEKSLRTGSALLYGY